MEGLFLCLTAEVAASAQRTQHHLGVAAVKSFQNHTLHQHFSHRFVDAFQELLLSVVKFLPHDG